jgi:hypothetical protein
MAIHSIGTLALFAVTLVILVGGASAQDQDHSRIERKCPTTIEVERIASDMAMKDSLLRKGDIVATDHGFFVFVERRRMVSQMFSPQLRIRLSREMS